MKTENKTSIVPSAVVGVSRKPKAAPSPKPRSQLCGDEPGENLGWRCAVDLLFEALDERHLRQDESLCKLQSAILKSSRLAYQPPYVPSEWRVALNLKSRKTDSEVLIVLCQIVKNSILGFSLGGLTTYYKHKPEITGVAPAAAGAAFQRLKSCGLIQWTELSTVNGNEVRLETTPTSKALIALLKAK